MILLSRVVTQLGSVSQVTPKVVEGLYAADLAYLQELYNHVNRNGHTKLDASCPRCEHQFQSEMATPGEA